jgi:DNA-binding transcriptional MerR regulator
MRRDALKVGELARRTGLTVRTLHHYDQIGLLKPSLHSDAGYRLYSPADVARLQRVLSLRQLGFSLEQIGDCLDRPGFSPLEVIGLHLAGLREQIKMQQKLCKRLETLAGQLRSAGKVSADEFLHTISEITMLETLQQKYFTPKQLKSFQAARDRLGPAQLEQKQEEWADLIAQLRTQVDRGTHPADPAVQALAKRWKDLIHFSTGGDPEVAQSIKRLWEEQGDTLAAQFGSKYDSRPVWGYVEKALTVTGNRSRD